MRSTIATILLLTLFGTPTVFADDIALVSTYEEECKKELGIDPAATITPGLTLGKLRDCIRNRTAEAKRAEAEPTRPTLRNRIERALQNALKLQQETGSAAVDRPAMSSRTFDLRCREMLGIASDEVLLPGLRKRELLQCIDNMHSEESRTANLRRRRGTVLDRTRTVGDKVLETETERLRGKLESTGAAARFRINTQKPIDADRLQNIRDSLRARTDFSAEYRRDSDAEKRQRAEQCRKVPTSEWAACIREALKEDAQEE